MKDMQNNYNGLNGAFTSQKVSPLTDKQFPARPPQPESYYHAADVRYRSDEGSVDVVYYQPSNASQSHETTIRELLERKGHELQSLGSALEDGQLPNQSIGGPTRYFVGRFPDFGVDE